MLLPRMKNQLHLIAFLAFPIVCFFWLFGGWTTHPTAVLNSISYNLGIDSKEQFIRTVVERPVLHEFKPKEMQDYCAAQTWSKDLVFKCDGIIGGIGSVRQQILTCIRWAMASGAAIVIPHPRPRRETNSTLGEGVFHKYTAEVDLGHFFDKDAFKRVLSTQCPQMRLYENYKLDGAKTIEVGELTVPDRVLNFNDESNLNQSEIVWKKPRANVTASMKLVSISRHFKSSLVCGDNEGFANSMGYILQTRQDVARIAATILYQMKVRFKLTLNPNNLLAPGGFASIHLRTSSDATKWGFMSYEKQVELYKKFLDKQPIPLIYVASGNLTSIELFARRVEPTPVVDKFSMLPPEDTVKLKAMSWDHQGEVDYLVLRSASLFLGMADSLFSMNIASTRRAASKSGTCGNSAKSEKDVMYNDGSSIVVGTNPWDNQDPRFFWP